MQSQTGTERDGRDIEDLPGAVSAQNGEEAESGHRDGSEQPEPRTGARGSEAGADGGSGSAPGGPGAAGEGSQATGHPKNAG
jgi:hypothetical protein